MVLHLANLMVATLGATILVIFSPLVLFVLAHTAARGLMFGDWNHPWKGTVICVVMLFIGMLFIAAGTS